jgi:hypothetical protein
MDWDTCNHQTINQRQTEAKRWKAGAKQPNERPAKKGAKVQPAKRKKKGKK